MLDLNVITAIGLIGVTLVIAVGKIFDPLREWLKGFTFWANPLRWAGEAMGCTMCAGWWVGFAWGIYTAQPWGVSVVLGGFVSVASFATDELLAIIAAVSIRLVRRHSPPPQMQVPEPLPRAPRVPDEEAPLTEEQANAHLDAAEEDDS